MPLSRSPFRSLLAAASLSVALAGCGDKPQELSSPPSTAAAQPAVAPLAYKMPGTWTRVGESQVDTTRESFKVPKAGGDTEEAQLTVLFFGTGSQGDPEKNFRAWLENFDGGALEKADKTTFDSPAGKVETIEFMGTYKVALGPPVGPKKKSPMQMVKEKWRLYAAVVHTKDRGNWFFKLVGPDDTVQASKNALKSTLEAAK